jgi:hypothetical protein
MNDHNVIYKGVKGESGNTCHKVVTLPRSSVVAFGSRLGLLVNVYYKL